MRNPIRFALVGCGAVASRHATQIMRFGSLAACCDIDNVKTKEFSRLYGGESYSSLNKMLEIEKNLDVVCICTPNGMHAAHTLSSLHAGCHVLCEKPMALRAVDCEEMISASATTGKHLFIVKQNRFNPPVAAVKKLIDQGGLGKIYSVQVNGFWNRTAEYYKASWKGLTSMSGGTLFAQFSHFIDLMYWFAGDVVEVQSYLTNVSHPTIEFEDAGVANFRFESGAIGNIHFTINSYEQNMEGSLTIFAEKGTVKIGGQYLNELSYQRLEGGTLPAPEQGNPPNLYGNYQGSMSNHDKVYQNLVDVIQEEAAIAISGLEGLKTVEIIEKIYRAGRHA